MRAPQNCNTMAELRSAIDMLDQNLIDLLVRRASYIDRAAVLKTCDGLPARIGSRVEEVVTNVRRSAESNNLDPDLAEELWRKLIDWSISREEKILGPSVPAD